MERRHRIDLLLTGLTAAALVIGGLLVLLGRPETGNRLWLGASLLVFIAVLIDIVAAALRRQAGIDLIALVAIGGAAALGENLTAAVIALMLGSGRVLEDFAERRAGREMSALLAKLPRFANRYEEGGLARISLDAIAPGDRLLVRVGETVPADGALLSELATLDESTLTGESLPVTRRAGEALLSGAVNAGAPFDLRAEQPAARSALAAIVRLVEQARGSKAPAARLADRYALLFVPLTVVLAGGAWLWSGDPVRALAVVVVATPCPLILAVPVAIVSAMSRCAGHGVLVKHGGAIELLAQGTILFFDKTGTLTGGQTRLTDIATAPGVDTETVLRLGASLDQMSDHAIAHAVVQAARERGLPLALPDDAVEQPGAGVAGIVEGHAVRIGSLVYVMEGKKTEHADWLHQFASRTGYEGAAGVYVGIDGHVAGALQMADEIRQDTPRALRLLRAAGVQRIVMLTGDRQDVAATIGDMLGVDQVLAQQTPQDKLDAIARARKEGVTLMVGDGVNDAPALAAADVGIAMGARGAAAAAEAAQVVLLVDRLDRLAFALRTARAARTIALQSVIAGMGLSLLAMIAAAFGFIAPLAGALLQEAIDVAVILNALRVLRIGRVPARISPEQAHALRDQHQALAPLIERIGRLGTALPGLAPQALKTELARLLAELHGMLLPHEREDDAALYPELARMIGGEDPLAPMNHTHREIYRLVRVLDRIGAQLASQAMDANGLQLRELQRTLHALDAILRMHFAQEEELYQNLA